MGCSIIAVEEDRKLLDQAYLLVVILNDTIYLCNVESLLNVTIELAIIKRKSKFTSARQLISV